jgi:ankyrin repeat protein
MGDSMSRVTDEYIKEFIIAAHTSLEKVQAVLIEHPELLNVAWNWSEDDSENALQAASHLGQDEVARYLLSLGAPNTITTAAMLGDVEAVKQFLHQDKSLALAYSAHKISLLFHITIGGKPEIADLVRLHGGAPEEDAPFALHAAIEVNSVLMMQWLLEHGAKKNPNVKNFRGKTPLQVAIEYQQTEQVNLLKAVGAVAESSS